jgi:hypothetical protein
MVYFCLRQKNHVPRQYALFTSLHPVSILWMQKQV